MAKMKMRKLRARAGPELTKQTSSQDELTKNLPTLKTTIVDYGGSYSQTNYVRKAVASESMRSRQVFVFAADLRA
jgi:hypothetical protein